VNEVSLRDRAGKYLRTVICQRCGLVWTDPRPAEEEVKEFYAHEYRLQYKGAWQPKFKHVYRGGKVSVNRFRWLRKFLRPTDAILDVGAGGGELVYLLRGLGYDARGLEPNEGYARYAREELKLPIEMGFFKELELGGKSFDVVTLFHVLEHLEDPAGTVARLRDCLKRHGHLIIEVPNVEAKCQAPGRRFHLAHLYNFNPATLPMLARRAGYEVLETVVSSDGGNVGIVARRLDNPQACAGEIPGNYEQVSGVIRRHTALSHCLSAYPYTRPFQRLGQLVDESAGIRPFQTRAAILDAMVAAAKKLFTERGAAAEH
jgi:SAM-dependent methyltransferase